MSGSTASFGAVPDFKADRPAGGWPGRPALRSFGRLAASGLRSGRLDGLGSPCAPACSFSPRTAGSSLRSGFLHRCLTHSSRCFAHCRDRSHFASRLPFCLHRSRAAWRISRGSCRTTPCARRASAASSRTAPGCSLHQASRFSRISLHFSGFCSHHSLPFIGWAAAAPRRRARARGASASRLAAATAGDHGSEHHRDLLKRLVAATGRCPNVDSGTG